MDTEYAESIDDFLRMPFTVTRLVARQARRSDEGLLDVADEALACEAELFAGDDAPAVALEIDSLERALRRLAEDSEDPYMRRRVRAARIRLRAYVMRRRGGLPVAMADLWRDGEEECSAA